MNPSLDKKRSQPSWPIFAAYKCVRSHELDQAYCFGFRPPKIYQEYLYIYVLR